MGCLMETHLRIGSKSSATFTINHKTMEKTDNELIEAFHVERGGIPHSESHLVFYESDPMRWMRQETYCNLLEIVCVKLIFLMRTIRLSTSSNGTTRINHKNNGNSVRFR